MKVWLKQHHNRLIDSYRYGRALFQRERGRVVVVCPDSDNMLINCSRAFFDAEVERGRIVFNRPAGA